MLWPTVSRPIHLGVGHPFGTHDQIFLFPFFCRKIALLFVLGLPLRREDGSVICSAICQWSVSRRTYNHKLLSHLRSRLWSSGQSCGYRSRGPDSIPGTTRFFWEVVGLERGPLSLVTTTEELLGWKISVSGLENRNYCPRRHTSIHKKFALT
jgi:hypothetical protein